MAVYDVPETTFVGGFIGNPPMNLLRARVEGANGRVRVALGNQSLDGPEELRSRIGQDVLLGIRAENLDVLPQTAAGSLPATVEVVEPLGADILLTAVLGEQRLKLLTRNDFEARPGQPIGVKPQADKLRWFDAEGVRLAGGSGRDYGSSNSSGSPPATSR
jgi:multiple sugar transport system ATP-binding protein